ncbi:MAG: AraC family transcriptional regulator [Caulobacteraceae bacterium]|nr:AraC family transcriptional regulator [Caulobacteraceae bacterium]
MTTAFMTAGTRGPWRAPGRLTAYGIAMAVSFACYAVGHVLNGAGGPAGTLLDMVGLGACGWAWLIARALFDPAKQDAWWPRIVVLVLVVSGALTVLTLPTSARRIAENTYALTGSAALLLTFFEPFHRYRRDLSAVEKRFRLTFVVVYAALVAVSILAPHGSAVTAAEAYRLDLINSGCAMGGLVTGAAAIVWRLRHPLAEPMRPARRAPTAEDQDLAARILRLLREDRIHAEPNLKVADVAARLGQPEYRVSQCVTGVLGFENFNRMINHHRIEQAKAMLRDPARRPILDIAFDCGFGSVGPFNRAFKAEVGVTPRAFRASAVAQP